MAASSASATSSFGAARLEKEWIATLAQDRIYIAAPTQRRFAAPTKRRKRARPPRRARRGSFDRVARRRLTSLDKLNWDSMRRSGYGGSSLHELITIS